jgi:hypothetical protein
VAVDVDQRRAVVAHLDHVLGPDLVKHGHGARGGGGGGGQGGASSHASHNIPASNWSHVENILKIARPIGHTLRMFS